MSDKDTIKILPNLKRLDENIEINSLPKNKEKSIRKFTISSKKFKNNYTLFFYLIIFLLLFPKAKSIVNHEDNNKKIKNPKLTCFYNECQLCFTDTDEKNIFCKKLDNTSFGSTYKLSEDLGSGVSFNLEELHNYYYITYTNNIKKTIFLIRNDVPKANFFDWTSNNEKHHRWEVTKPVGNLNVAKPKLHLYYVYSGWRRFRANIFFLTLNPKNIYFNNLYYDYRSNPTLKINNEPELLNISGENIIGDDYVVTFYESGPEYDKAIITYMIDKGSSKEIRAVIIEEDKIFKTPFTIEIKKTNFSYTSFDMTKSNLDNYILTYADKDENSKMQIYYKILDQNLSQIQATKKLSENSNANYTDKVKILSIDNQKFAVACFVRIDGIKKLYCRKLDFLGNLFEETLINNKYDVSDINLENQSSNLRITTARNYSTYSIITTQRFRFDMSLITDYFIQSKKENVQVAKITENKFMMVWRDKEKSNRCYRKFIDLNGKPLQSDRILSESFTNLDYCKCITNDTNIFCIYFVESNNRLYCKTYTMDGDIIESETGYVTYDRKIKYVDILKLENKTIFIFFNLDGDNNTHFKYFTTSFKSLSSYFVDTLVPSKNDYKNKKRQCSSGNFIAFTTRQTDNKLFVKIIEQNDLAIQKENKDLGLTHSRNLCIGISDNKFAIYGDYNSGSNHDLILTIVDRNAKAIISRKVISLMDVSSSFDNLRFGLTEYKANHLMYYYQREDNSGDVLYQTLNIEISGGFPDETGTVKILTRPQPVGRFTSKVQSIDIVPLANGGVFGAYVIENLNDDLWDSIVIDKYIYCDFANHYQRKSFYNHACDYCDSPTNKGTLSGYSVSSRSNCYVKTMSTTRGYYKNISVWSKCESDCDVCTSSSSCTYCKIDYFETYANKCIKESEIPDYYLYSTSTKWFTSLKKYRKCNEACNGCTGYLDSECKACATNYYPLVDKPTNCYSKTKLIYYYYFLTNDFQKCHEKCRYCENEKEDGCTTCNYNLDYYSKEESKNICEKDYPGWWVNKSIKHWVICDVSCKLCVKNATNCIECNPNYYKIEDGNTCFTKDNSPDNYYFEPISSDGPPPGVVLLHKRCDVSCITCKDSPKFCLKCNNSKGYYHKDSNPNSCIKKEDAPGFYVDSTLKKFLPCDGHCKKCEDKADKCTECDKLKYFAVHGVEYICKTLPYQGYYLHSIDKVFKKCSDSCATCENTATNCLNCKENYFPLYNDKTKCFQTCPEKHWKNTVAKNCSPCNASCKNCTDGTNKCLSCADGYLPLADNPSYCYTDCPPTYVKDEEKKVCKNCPKNCERCTLDDKCTFCSKDFFLKKSDEQCYEKCDKTFWANHKNRQCDKCIFPCNECLFHNKCINCVKDYYLSPNSEAFDNCLSESPSGYFADPITGKCLSCREECKLCSSADVCFSCIGDYNYLKQENKCLKKCPDGFYSSKKPFSSDSLGLSESLRTCEFCDKGCTKCRNYPFYCLSCSEKYFFLEEENRCYDLCPRGFYDDRNKGICSKCDISCNTCQGKNADDCLSCKNDLILKEGSCLEKGCPYGYIELEDGKCLKYTDCIVMTKIILPSIFDLEEIDFLAKFEIFFDRKCPLDLSNFKYKWNKFSYLEKFAEIKYFNTNIKNIKKEENENRNNKDNIPIDNSEIDDQKFISTSNYSLKRKLLLEGNHEFSVQIFYKEDNILDIKSHSNFVLNKLIPRLKIEKDNNFFYGYDIKIDASESRDESNIRSGNISKDQRLLFSWECPLILRALCERKIQNFKLESNNNSIFLLRFSDYKKFIKFPEKKDYMLEEIDYIDYEIKLVIKKDLRKAEKVIKFRLNKAIKADFDFMGKNLDLSKLIVLEVSSLSNTDLIIKSSLMDKKIDMQKFKYFWTVPSIKNREQYINGRKDIDLRLKYSDLLVGKNTVIYSIIDPKNDKKYYKTIELEKFRNPYGGNCIVDPIVGYSFSTEFTFRVENWRSINAPLLYKIKYLNKNNVAIDVSNGGFIGSKFSTKILPVSKSFILEIQDNQGYKTNFQCNVEVKKNKNLKNLDYYLKNIYDVPRILTITESYDTNKLQDEHDNDNKKLGLIDLFLYDINVYQFLENYEKIVSSLIQVSSTDNFEVNKVYKILNVIMKFIDPLISDLPKVDYLYSILDNINSRFLGFGKEKENKNSKNLRFLEDKKINDEKNSDTKDKNNNNSEEDIDNDNSALLKMLELLQGILNILDQKLFNNIIPGQGVFVNNNNFDIQLNKISSINPTNICIDAKNQNNNKKRVLKGFNDYESNIKIYKAIKTNKIRRLQQNNQCSSGNVLDLDSNKLENVMKKTEKTNLGFQSQYIKNKNIPVETNSNRKIFSETSLDFALSIGDENKLRKLSAMDNTIDTIQNLINLFFEIRLKIPKSIDSNIAIKNTCCVQYSKDKKTESKKRNPNVSCDSWYDTETHEVVCFCKDMGLTVNVFDKVLSNVNKIQQFPALDVKLLNPYSIGIVGVLILTFSIIYIWAGILDERDNKTKIHMNDENYDFIQYFTIKFYKENLHADLSFISLYIYLLRYLHPIMSLIHIYSPFYGRPLRVMDFFLAIYLTFFFQTLPLYMTENQELKNLENERSIKNRDRTVKDLQATITQILQGVMYSIFSSVCSIIITQFLTFIFFFKVSQKESENNRKFLTRAINKKYGLKELYHEKLQCVMRRVKMINLITKEYRRKLKEEKLRKLENENKKKLIDENINFLNENNNNKDNDNDNDSNFDINKYFNENKIKNFIEKEKEGEINLYDKYKEKERDSLMNQSQSLSINKSSNYNFLITNSNRDKIKNKKLIEGEINHNKNFKNSKNKDKDNNNNPSHNKNFFKLKNFNKLLKEENTDLDFNHKLGFSDNYEKEFNNSNNKSELEDKSILNFISKEKNSYGNLEIEKVQELNFEALWEKKDKKFKKIFLIRYRPLIYHLKDFKLKENKFSCFVIYITNVPKVNYVIKSNRSHLKTIFILGIYTFIWISLFIFIQGIYKNYADNIWQLCVMPLVIMPFVKLCITCNITIFLTAVVLYNFGYFYVNRKRFNLWQKILLNATVPPMALNHYSALVFYRKFINDY